MKKLLERWNASRLGRTVERYIHRHGNVLAGGVAYAAIFSVFGALVAGFSVFGLVLGGNEQLFDAMTRAVDANLPGLLDVGPDGGPVDPESLVDPNLVSVTGIIAFLTSVVAGLGWLGALRQGLRAVLGLPFGTANVIVKKLKDLLALVLLGVGILASAVVSLGVGAGASALLRSLGMEGGTASSLLLRLLTLVVVAVVDALLLWVIFRVLAGVRLPWPAFRGPLLSAGAAMAVLASLSGLLVGSAGSRNPLLATGAALVGLLLLLNLISRVILFAAAWISTGPYDVAPEDHTGSETGSPAEVDLVKHGQPVERVRPSYSTRAADRTTIAAGVVLGAVAVTALRVLGQGASTVLRSVRGR